MHPQALLFKGWVHEGSQGLQRHLVVTLCRIFFFDGKPVRRGKRSIFTVAQNRKRDHRRHREMDTSRVDGVKASHTRRDRRFYGPLTFCFSGRTTSWRTCSRRRIPSSCPASWATNYSECRRSSRPPCQGQCRNQDASRSGAATLDHGDAQALSRHGRGQELHVHGAQGRGRSDGVSVGSQRQYQRRRECARFALCVSGGVRRGVESSTRVRCLTTTTARRRITKAPRDSILRRQLAVDMPHGSSMVFDPSIAHCVGNQCRKTRDASRPALTLPHRRCPSRGTSTRRRRRRSSGRSAPAFVSCLRCATRAGARGRTRLKASRRP